MTKPALLLLASLACLLPASARGAAAEGGSYKVRIPKYDDETGELVWVVEAATLEPVPDSEDSKDLTTVRIELHADGALHAATAEKGRVDTKKNTGVLRGNVVLRFDDETKTRVETEVLAWDGEKGTAHTDEPVTIRRTDMTIRGIGLDLRVRDVEKPGTEEKQRADELVIRRNVRVDIAPTTQDWLLPSRRPAKAPRPPEQPKEEGPKEGEEGKQGEPIVVTSTGSLTVFRLSMTAIFRENVRTVQGKKSMTSNMLTLHFVPSKEDQDRAVLDRVRAEGDVRIDDGETIALADIATWTREEGTSRLVGRPAEVRWDNGNRLTSPVIVSLRGGAELHALPAEEGPGGLHLLSFPAPPRPASEGKEDVSARAPAAEDR
ncbi:MAG: LPS export ABC transporter periplasmic protein LptC [bacterium]